MKGVKKIKYETSAVLLDRVSALYHNMKVRPISKIPTYNPPIKAGLIPELVSVNRVMPPGMEFLMMIKIRINETPARKLKLSLIDGLRLSFMLISQ